ncbi:MAG TPA: glycosyltransferase family 39 protein, partial [candidate division Zixibacteria bacterium]|nr:glycosyltransferase family 39 protein [candidate division Zixibacteria bacterium]
MWRELTTIEKRRLFTLALAAALVRAVYLWLYSRRPEWGELVVDSLFHVNWADDIAGGNVIGDRAFFRSPLYIYVLALFRWLAPTALWPARVFGSALGVVSVVLTYLLVRRVYRGKHSERAALAAAALQAVYPSVIYFEAELLVDFLFTVLLQAALFLALTAGAARRRWLWAGALVGLAALTRATGLVALPLLAYWAWRDFRQHQRPLGGPLSVVIAALVVIAPVSLRNVIVSGDFTLIATSGGVNFYIGANPAADPVSAALPEPYGAHWRLSDMRGLAEEFEGRALTDAEVSASWRNRAFEWIVSHPVDFGALYLRKLGALLYTHPYSNNRALSVEFAANAVTRFSPLNFAALLSLAALGLAVSWN